MKVRGSELLAVRSLEALGFERSESWSSDGVCTDSRKLARGNLFVALRGERFDGHDFVSAAVEAGAAGVVVDRRWAEANRTMTRSLAVPRLVVEDTVEALGALALMHRKKFRIPVVAIGGSNGKTTTKDMVRDVLKTTYTVLATEGNLNNAIGVPQTLFRLDRSHEVAVVEMGTNHPGEIAALCAIAEPTHALLTNIGREHLEYFGSLDGVAKAESELFLWVVAHRGLAFVNADDARLARIGRRFERRTTFGFRSRSADLKGSRLRSDERGNARFVVRKGKGRPFAITLAVPGSHNAMNALAAAAVGLTFKVPTRKIAHSLTAFVASSKRMEVVTAGPITILNDTYNANPDSVLAALRTLAAQQTAGRRIAILADMLELGAAAEQAHRSIGAALRRHRVDQLLAFGPLSRTTMQAAGAVPAEHFEDKAALIRRALECVAPGDAVLIKGSRGMRMEEVVSALTAAFTTAG